MIWRRSWRADPRGAALADRHYTRQSPGAAQFMPTGSCAVFYARTAAGEALWGTSAPFAEHVKHAWAGAWMCSIFHNAGAGRSSDLIRQAVAATRHHYGEPPALGMVTFVDPEATARHRSPHHRPGWCFRKAGFVEVGVTKEQGLIALQLLPAHMPPAEPALGASAWLFGDAA